MTSMTKAETKIKKKLEELYEALDDLQETSTAQTNGDLMWEIGEAMGHIDNAIDSI